MSEPSQPGRSCGGSAASPDDLARLRDRLLRCVRRYRPSWMSAHEEDIVQAALVRAVELRKKGPDRELTDAYFDRVAYGLTIDEIRRQRRRREDPPEDEAAMSAHHAPSGNPETGAASREIGRAVADCLTRLVAPRRRAVTLYLQGHSVPSVGRLFGWSTRKAESLVYRGIGDLRRCLSGKGVTP